jgi:malonate-semialdehyde dehydrogenase (acetylating)/methylmalonate-semialdehyde dehydrogenase
MEAATARMKYPKVRNFYNGEFVESGSNDSLDVTSPVDGNLLSTVPFSTQDELEAAVQSAKGAAESWGNNPIKERAQVFFRYRYLLEKHFEELTELVAEENGKTFAEASAEVEKSIELTEFACSMPQLVSGEILEVSKGVECRTEHFPLGVVASIVPWCRTGRCPTPLYSETP